MDADIICLWPGSVASIPAGWSRASTLDKKHLKGITDNTTDPGGTGGTASHTHSSPVHNHVSGHTHQVSGVAYNPNLVTASSGTVTGSHGHNAGTSSNFNSNNDNSTVTLNAASNDPAYLTAIAIKASGASDFPDGCMLLFNDLVPPAGWSLCDGSGGTTDMSAKYMKIADSGLGGGSTGGGNTHTHTNANHNHTFPSHTHTGNVASTSGSTGGGGSPTRSLMKTHNHAYTTDGNTDSSSSDSVTIGTNSLEPLYITIAIIENTSGAGSLEYGLIAIWIGLLINIPADWVLCDGTNGTPDLTGKFIKGTKTSIGDTGGNTSVHTHSPSTHTHTHTGHNHSGSTTGPAGSSGAVVQGTGQRGANLSHTHVLSVGTVPPTCSAYTITLNALSSTADQLPEYYEVAYIQFRGGGIPPTLTPRYSALIFQNPGII
jgi:hypothetical protein